MSLAETSLNLEEEVSNTLVQRMHGQWTPADQAALEAHLASDAEYAHAYRRAEESLGLLVAHSSAPEMMRFRERALAYARLSTAKRWFGSDAGPRNGWRLAASLSGVLIVMAAAWQFSPWGERAGHYHTAIGEQRLVELADHSRITLDAATRLAVRYTGESRTIELIEGQAQFSVAKDPVRPFKVHAGERTIIALGTVFTVEYTGQRVHVAMLEGKVAVIPGASPGAQPPAAELSAGQELKVSEDGRTTVIPKADLEAVTAWRNGKVIFKAEKLGDAIRRMNRYSRLQLEIADPALADEPISGVFEAGDTQGFIRAAQLALPVVISYRDKDTVRLSLRR